MNVLSGSGYSLWTTPLFCCCLGALAAIACSSDSEEQLQVTDLQMPTQAPPIPIELVASTPAPAAFVNGGQQIHVWVTTAQPSGLPCIDLFESMIPAGASSASGSVATCIAGEAEATRARFVQGSQGVLQLQAVVLLLLGYGHEKLPANYSEAACDEVIDNTVPAEIEARPFPEMILFTCSVVPYSGSGGTPRSLWGAVLEGTDITQIPSNVRCWELIRYLGGPGGRRTIPVPCVLE